MNAQDVVGTIVAEQEWAEGVAARAEGLSPLERAALRLAESFASGQVDSALLEFTPQVGALILLGDYTPKYPVEIADLYEEGPHGILLGVRTGLRAAADVAGDTAQKVAYRLIRSDELIMDGSARRLLQLKLRLHVEACVETACEDARLLIAASELGYAQVALAWAWAQDPWGTVLPSLASPVMTLEHRDGWSLSAQDLGATLAGITRPEAVARRVMAGQVFRGNRFRIN
jgi:hypothetical protein